VNNIEEKKPMMLAIATPSIYAGWAVSSDSGAQSDSILANFRLEFAAVL
jgi:hypothetical protein